MIESRDAEFPEYFIDFLFFSRIHPTPVFYFRRSPCIRLVNLFICLDKHALLPEHERVWGQARFHLQG
ncbi:MAG TPA: hypothetical protein DD706_00750 [Nitrospiraceae bacterium]|nr:hypothetical protein [Nitrospiraceae bacterium]